MSFLKNNKIYMLLIYINILFVVTLAKISYKIENLNYGFISALILTGMLFCWITSSVRKKSVKLGVVLLIIVVTIFYYFSKTDYVNSMFSKYIIENFNIINSLVAQNKATDYKNYLPIFIIVIPVLTYIMMYLTTRGLPNFTIIAILTMLITLWYLGYTEEIKKYLFLYVFITLVTYSINEFVKKTKKLTKSGIKVGIRGTSLIIYTVVLSLIIAGISNLLPQSYKGKYGSDIQGRFYNKFGNRAENGEQKGNKYKYDLSFSGYESTKLGGPITLNKLVAFRVRSDKPYYLKGSVKDFYDGYSWSQSEKKYTSRVRPEDSMLVDLFSKDYADATNEIEIHPEELNSSTIFTPMLSFNVNLDMDYIFYDEASTFMSSGIIEKPYTVYFYDLNSRAARLLNSGNSSQSYRETDNEHYNSSYKKYLQVPDNISQRVYDLVSSLTKGKKTNFQKVQAIREYLNKAFPYTLKVSSIPEGQEFLDYFLFTEKKGYCTYFATAETIMCRIAGIPARYVEGFNMGQEKDENDFYVVRNENAHAWTEVLYKEDTNTGIWYTVDAVPYAVEAIHQEEKEAELEQKPDPVQEVEPNIDIPKKPQDASNEYSSSVTKYGLVVPPLLLKIIKFLSVLVFVNTVIFLIYSRRKTFIINNQSIIPLYKYSLDRLSVIGYNQSEYVPELEALEKMPANLSERIKEVAELAYREYYGSKAPVQYDKSAYYNFIEEYIKRQQPTLRYLLKKYYFSNKIPLIFKKIMVLYRKIRLK